MITGTWKMPLFAISPYNQNHNEIISPVEVAQRKVGKGECVYNYMQWLKYNHMEICDYIYIYILWKRNSSIYLLVTWRGPGGHSKVKSFQTGGKTRALHMELEKYNKPREYITKRGRLTGTENKLGYQWGEGMANTGVNNAVLLLLFSHFQ